jgi:hypothetical protein
MHKVRLQPDLITCILVLLVSCSPQLIHAQETSQTVTQEAPSFTIQRPKIDDLVNLILSSDSVISSNTQKSLVTYLAKIDLIHQDFAVTHGARILEKGDAIFQVKNAQLKLPKLTPLCERTINYVILMQVDMLNKVLFSMNRELAEAMRKETSMVRLLKPQQRVFGDIRDQVIAEILQGLNNINKLHIALGISNELDISYPTHIKTQQQIEEYILLKIAALTSNAKLLKLVGV